VNVATPPPPGGCSHSIKSSEQKDNKERHAFLVTVTTSASLEHEMIQVLIEICDKISLVIVLFRVGIAEQLIQNQLQLQLATTRRNDTTNKGSRRESMTSSISSAETTFKPSSEEESTLQPAALIRSTSIIMSTSTTGTDDAQKAVGDEVMLTFEKEHGIKYLEEVSCKTHTPTKSSNDGNNGPYFNDHAYIETLKENERKRQKNVVDTVQCITQLDRSLARMQKNRYKTQTLVSRTKAKKTSKPGNKENETSNMELHKWEQKEDNLNSQMKLLCSQWQALMPTVD
jgi:hypothetical protein